MIFLKQGLNLSAWDVIFGSLAPALLPFLWLKKGASEQGKHPVKGIIY